MKKIIMIIGMAVATIGFGFAQETQEGQMTRINQIELPLSAQEDLTLGEYSDWDVVEVFELSAESGAGEAYEVIVSREAEVMSLFYDENGNLIRRERKDDE